MAVMKKCPSCLREINGTSRFCKYCGEPLKQCPECKELNKAGDSFCALCGTDIREVEAPEVKGDITEQIAKQPTEESLLGEKQEKLIVWPPTRPYGTGLQPRTMQQQYSRQQAQMIFQETQAYEPKTLLHPYAKSNIIGFLRGPLPTINVLSATFEAFALALALIAFGVVIAGIGLTFFQTLVLPILGGIIGGSLALSAPFFGIYYVSSNWLYKTFGIKRPVKNKTIIINYALANLLLTFFGMALSPLFIEGGALNITFSVIGGVVYLVALTIVPLKAFLADLVYVKAATKMKEEEKKEEKEEQEEETEEVKDTENQETDKKVEEEEKKAD
ncbi:MAG: zinc ribbon domain-containing protein [Candidatus Heimdallarchaeaceae archaeon]